MPQAGLKYGTAGGLMLVGQDATSRGYWPGNLTESPASSGNYIVTGNFGGIHPSTSMCYGEKVVSLGGAGFISSGGIYRYFSGTNAGKWQVGFFASTEAERQWFIDNVKFMHINGSKMALTGWGALDTKYYTLYPALVAGNDVANGSTHVVKFTKT